MAHLIFPSILSADFTNLQLVCETVNSSKADGFHLDVMDGLFVPNISFGFPIIVAIQKNAGANILTVHFEACKNLKQTINIIKKLGMKASIAINPQTPVSCLAEIISDIESVCIMSVNPGFGGQTFIENTYNKIEQMKEIIRIKKSNALIKVDGGIDLSNSFKLVHAGADILVAGTSVFGSKEPIRTIEMLKNI
jgi:ribulose-phosphate 3-epimerase